MTPAHRARLVAALNLETGLEWEQTSDIGEVQQVGGPWFVSTHYGEQRLARMGRMSPRYVLPLHAGRNWPERLAATVAKIIKERA